MLDKLLALLQGGHNRRLDELARALDTTPQLVVLMLDQLVSLGFLTQLNTACPHICAGCPSANACTTRAGDRAWALTQKGAARRG